MAKLMYWQDLEGVTIEKVEWEDDSGYADDPTLVYLTTTAGERIMLNAWADCGLNCHLGVSNITA